MGVPLRSALCAALLATAAAAQPQLLDGIAAQVDDKVVLISEVLEVTRGRELAMRSAGAPDAEILRLRASALEQLIEDRLMQRLIEQNEMQADEEEINETVAGIAAENGISVEQLYASVVYHGLSVESYRAQIKGDLERRNLIHAAVGARVEVEDEDVRDLYRQRYADQTEGGERVRVRQILRAVGGPSQRPASVACREVREARARVQAGEDFAAVAAELSEVAPEAGGEIGWLPLESAAVWMREALRDLPPGGVSEVLELPFGCSLLQLVERGVVEAVSFEQAEAALHRELWEKQVEQEYRSWVEDLRSNSYIDRRGYFDELAGGGMLLALPEAGQ